MTKTRTISKKTDELLDLIEAELQRGGYAVEYDDSERAFGTWGEAFHDFPVVLSVMGGLVVAALAGIAYMVIETM